MTCWRETIAHARGGSGGLSRVCWLHRRLFGSNLKMIKKKRTKFSYKIGYSLKLQTHLIKINITAYFENLTVELHVLYALNTHVKFCVNWTLFTISSIILYFMHNFKLQKLAI